MGCNCGKAGRRNLIRTADGQPGEVVGFQVTLPDGTTYGSMEAPIFSYVEARSIVRQNAMLGKSGGTVRRLIRAIPQAS